MALSKKAATDIANAINGLYVWASIRSEREFQTRLYSQAAQTEHCAHVAEKFRTMYHFAITRRDICSAELEQLGVGLPLTESK